MLHAILQLSYKSEIILRLKGYFNCFFRKKRVLVIDLQTVFRTVPFKMAMARAALHFWGWLYFSADKIITNENHND